MVGLCQCDVGNGVDDVDEVVGGKKRNEDEDVGMLREELRVYGIASIYKLTLSRKFLNGQLIVFLHSLSLINYGSYKISFDLSNLFGTS